MHGAENQPTEAAFEPLLHFEMEMGAFLSDWNHCDQLSTFMARMISHNRTDPIRHSNFFSSALNELLEVSFRSGSPDGRIGCAVYRWGPTERVELTFPCPPGQRQFYREAVSKTRDADAMRATLIPSPPISHRVARLFFWTCRSISMPTCGSTKAIRHRSGLSWICLLKEW